MARPFFLRALGLGDLRLSSRIPLLRWRYRVIAIDLPGYGHSEGRPDVMSPRKMGAFLVKVIARLNLERVHAVGPDVGALTRLFAAADHPGVFVSLAVGGGAVRVDLAAGELNVIATPKGTFAAMNGADVMADYLTQAGKLTPAAIIEDFRMASAGQGLKRRASMYALIKMICQYWGRGCVRFKRPFL